MQKIILSFTAILILLVFSANPSYGFSFTKISPQKHTASASLAAMKVSDFTNLSVEEYSILSGTKLTIANRLSFKLLKLKMKHQLKKNPEITVENYFEAERGFSVLWFLAGLLVPLAGALTGSLPIFLFFAASPLIIAYVTEQERFKIKSILLGLGAGLLIIIAGLILIILSFAGDE